MGITLVYDFIVRNIHLPRYFEKVYLPLHTTPALRKNGEAKNRKSQSTREVADTVPIRFLALVTMTNNLCAQNRID